jgi:hypothetical protein
LEDFQKIVPGGVEGFEAPVVKNEKFGAWKGTQQTRMRASRWRQRMSNPTGRTICGNCVV